MNTPGLTRFSRVITTKRAGKCHFCATATAPGVDYAAVNGHGEWIAVCSPCAGSITAQVKGMTVRLQTAAAAVTLDAQGEAMLRSMLPATDAHAAALSGTATETQAFDVLIKLLASITFLADATKPQADTTLLAGLQAVANNATATPRDRSFAMDLVNHLQRKGALSERQAPYADKLIARYTKGGNAIASVPVTPLDNGLYLTLASGEIHKLYTTQNDRQAAKVLTVINGHGSFDYVKGGTREVAQRVAKGEARVLTQDEAAAFGRQHGFCCNCCRDLTDDRSLAAGYGPVCADNLGWWYPTADEAAAILQRPTTVASDACEGGECGPVGTWSCSKHGAEYQARHGRAANE
jgi:hypothetical protein